MKSNKFNYFGSVGIIIYIVISLIDQVVVKIPDLIYILFMLVALILLGIGIVIDRKKGKKQ